MTQDFASRVIAWQRAHGRHGLPWQNTRDAYRIWVSEIMLQQTQVATVLPYYLRFVASFPDVTSLARASIDDVLAHWAGLGYYRRAHHLHRAARVVVDRFAGEFPRDAATLATLPGIGRSTANAIAAFAYGERQAILDGNVKRVLARHRGVAVATWEIADALLPGDDMEAYTQGMMDLGATICTRSPACLHCPVNEDCIARIEGRIDELPAPRPSKPLPHRDVRVLVIERDGHVLFEKRPTIGIWGGLWSLPECTLTDDVRDVVRARFSADVEVRDALPPLAHGFTHFALTIHPQRLTASRWPPRVEEAAVAWMLPSVAVNAGLPAPIKRLMHSLATAANL